MTTATQVGIPEKRGPGHWFVPSGTVGYHVRFVSGRWVCQCASHRFRPYLACKHIAAVKQSRKEVDYRG